MWLLWAIWTEIYEFSLTHVFKIVKKVVFQLVNKIVFQNNLVCPPDTWI